MIKLSCEPTRLTQLLKQSLADGKATISDTSLLKFTPKKVIVNCKLSSDTVVFAQYGKSYFKSYDVASDEELMATESLVKELSHGFKSENAALTTDAEKVYIIGDGQDDKIDEMLTEIDKKKEAIMNGKLVHVKETAVGMIPYTSPEETETIPFNLQALVSVERFSDLPEYEQVTFVYDGSTLVMHFSTKLNGRHRNIVIEKYANNNEPVEDGKQSTAITIGFNMKLLQQLVAQFEGKIWLSINDGMLLISQMNKDYSLTYMGAVIAS